jgi:hypothetical protein
MHIVVVFDLVGAEPAAYAKAHDVLAGLGMSHVREGTELPNTTVMGEWYPDVQVTKIRDAIWTAFAQHGVPVSRLFVASIAAAAWQKL